MRIFVSRTDRLGDVMMALPTLQYLREALPAAEIDFCCPRAFRELLAPFLSARNISWVEAPDWKSYSAALFLNHHSAFLRRAWKARVPLRFGNRSRLSSFLFLNGSLRQARSAAEKNEGLYTLDLGRAFVERLTGEEKLPVLTPILLAGDEASRAAAEKLVGEDAFAVLHPGMGGGSALNLSADQYLEVAQAVEKAFGAPVYLSEGPSLEDKKLVGELTARHPARVLRGLELPVVREVFRRARVVVAPSTGPLHLAHYVGATTIGLYSPVQSQRPERWAVWGGAGAATTLVPKVRCPGVRDCLGRKCPEFFCMDKLNWSRLILGEGEGN